jgi:RNA polymerase sigma factor (TIGR02999 family)
MSREMEVQGLLARLRAGETDVEQRLLPLLYDELRAVARAHMAAQRPEHTLQPTALVHEAWLKVARSGERGWADRMHFVRLASAAMRQVLVDHARRRESLKRKPSGERVELEALVHDLESRSGPLLDLEGALERLGRRDPRAVRLVELRFFGGCSLAQAAESLGVSERQATRWWAATRLLLAEELERG